MRIKFFLMSSGALYQDEFMFDTFLNLLDHSTMLLVLIIFRHPVRGTILQSPFLFVHALILQFWPIFLFLQSPSWMLNLDVKHTVVLILNCSVLEEKAKRRTNLQDLTHLFSLLLHVQYFCNIL